MAPERLIHKKWPPQQPDRREPIHQSCVSGRGKHDAVAGCAGMFSTRAASLPAHRHAPREAGEAQCRPRFLPDTEAGVRAEDQGTPAADLESRVEKQGCSAPSSGAPGDSDLPRLTSSEHASTHEPRCPWLQLPSPANHVTVQAAELMLLAEEAGLQGGRTASVSGQRRRSGFKRGGWLRRDYVVGV